MFDLTEDHVILQVTHGSHAYGLAGAGSDLDTRGVAIAPLSEYLGMSPSWEQHEDKVTDTVIWDLKKFMRLAAGGNPNVLEVLFVPSAMVHKVTKPGQVLLDHRDRFLSLKVRGAMLEYARSQFEKARKHHEWILMGPVDPETRFSDPDLRKSYRKWLTERSEKTRAREDKCAYDSKHMSHCFRLLYQTKTLFESGHLVVHQDTETREFLMRVKTGDVPFETVLGEYESLYPQVQDLASQNKVGLPDAPDYDYLNGLCASLIKEFSR